MINYLVPDTLVSGCLKDKRHLFGKLQGGEGNCSGLSHIHGSNPAKSLVVFGSVIQVNACVVVTNHTSGLNLKFNFNYLVKLLSTRTII